MHRNMLLPCDQMDLREETESIPTKKNNQPLRRNKVAARPPEVDEESDYSDEEFEIRVPVPAPRPMLRVRPVPPPRRFRVYEQKQ